jgi:hypothetical protein
MTWMQVREFGFFRIVLFSLLLGISSGCSTFNRDWKRAAALPPSANNIEGRWEGSWLSEASGHQGRLRCLVGQSTNGHYTARFHANYRKVLGFSYTVALDVRKAGDNFTFVGDEDLGWYAGGKYHYEGLVTSTNFFSTYRCKYDHGTFQMTRPR